MLLDVQEILQDVATDSSKVRMDWMSVSSAVRVGQGTSVPPNARKSEELTLTGNYVYTAFAEAPPEARRVLYKFHAADHPITNVTIRLGQSRREVTVAGTSRYQVVRLSNVIRKRLESSELSTLVDAIVVYGHAILYFALFAVPLLVILHFRGIHNHPILAFIALALYAMMCRYLMSGDLWSAWFPATQISHGRPGLLS